MKTHVVLACLVVLFLIAGCVSFPAIPPAPPTSAPAPVPATDATDAWQTYANPAGFSISYPATWSQEESRSKPAKRSTR